MKTLTLIIALMLPVSAQADYWSQRDTYTQASYLVLHVADWAQTRRMAKGQCAEGYICHDTNPVIGAYPSTGDVDRYFIATAVIHTFVAYNLPKGWRTKFQYLTITVQVVAIGNNHANGLGLSFRF